MPIQYQQRNGLHTSIYKSPPKEDSQSENIILHELHILENTPVFNELNYSFTINEVINAVSALKSGKSPGMDGIPAEMLKATCHILSNVLLKIFNHVLLNCKYPKAWTSGTISPVLKKGTPLDTDNYRGITVTNSMSKIFSIMMNNRLTKFCIEHSIIDERQNSHKKGARTSDNVFIIRSLYEKYCVKRKSKLFTCFIDFRKAFDSVWHEGLFLKLLRNNIGGSFYRTLKAMYLSNTSVVKLNDMVTQAFPIHSGVRQGDVLSPLLFNIFINDIIKEFHAQECHTPSLIAQDVGCLLYADDLVIMSTKAEGLQYSLNKLASYCKKWKLNVNMAKSKTMCFSKGRHNPVHQMKYNDIELEQVQSYSYLGIELSSNGSFKAAEKCMSSKAQKALFKLKTLLTDSSLKPSTCLKLFDQLIKPICLYGSEIWGIDEFRFNNICRFNKTLELFLSEKLNLSFSKYTLGVHKKAQNSAVRGELGRLPLGVDIAANILMYYNHIKFSTENTLLRESLELSQLNGEQGWNNKTQQLKEYILMCANVNENLPLCNRKQIKQYLKTIYEQHWHMNIQQESKMRTYIKFKYKFQYESYLDILKSQHRKSFTRFRVSAHNLAIERGRYSRPPLTYELRVCPSCPLSVQDETHFLFNCSQYDTLRNTLFNNITQHCSNFNSLTQEEKLFFLMNTEGNILKEVCTFIHSCLP